MGGWVKEAIGDDAVFLRFGLFFVKKNVFIRANACFCGQSVDVSGDPLPCVRFRSGAGRG